MGDPKFSRRQYEEPEHPWKGDRIEREDEYVRKYGLKNKREFWKAESMLRQQRAQARQYLPLVLRDDEQGKKEAGQLIHKLNRLGLLSDNADLDDVLALDVDAVLSRRLQTLTFLKGLANTPRQARQFITHGHIAVDGQRVDVPGYLVESDEEPEITYTENSPLRNEAHPLHQGVDRPQDIGVGDTPDIEGPGAGGETEDEQAEEETEEEASEEEAAEPEDEEEEEADEEQASEDESSEVTEEAEDAAEAEPEAEAEEEAEDAAEAPETEPEAEAEQEPEAESPEPEAEQQTAEEEAEEAEDAEQGADEEEAEDEGEDESPPAEADSEDTEEETA